MSGKLLWLVTALLILASMSSLVKAEKQQALLYASAGYDAPLVVDDKDGTGKRYKCEYKWWNSTVRYGAFKPDQYTLVGNGWHYFTIYAAYCADPESCRVEGRASFRSVHSFRVGYNSSDRFTPLYEKYLQIDVNFDGAVNGTSFKGSIDIGLDGRQLAAHMDLRNITQANFMDTGVFVYWASVDMIVYYLKVAYRVTGESIVYQGEPTIPTQLQDTSVRVVAVLPSRGSRFWDLILPVSIHYTGLEGSGLVSGYTLFIRDFKVKSRGGIIFRVEPLMSGEAYLPLRSWSCSSPYGCSISYVAGNLTRFLVYSSRYSYGLVQSGPLTGSYKLVYQIDYYSSRDVLQPFTPVIIEAGSGSSWRTLATHDKPTNGVVTLNVQLNNEYVRFRGGDSGYASLATAAIAEPVQVVFREWGAICSHYNNCKFCTDCSGRNYSNGVCDGIPWGYVICPSSYCSWACDSQESVTCLPLIAWVDVGKMGYLGFRYASIPSYRLTINVRTHDDRPANGTLVRVTGSSGAVYTNTTDANGTARFTLPAGSYSVRINETYYGPTLTAGRQSTKWRRYLFWRWSDGSASNPRTVDLSSDTTLTAYAWDERALLIRWEPHIDGDTWGIMNATSWERIGYDSIIWLKRGHTVHLIAFEGGGMVFTYWRVGLECYRGTPYSSEPLLSLAVGDRGLSAIAVFRLAATNQTMLPPGAAVANPITYVPGTTVGGEERMGKRGWWLLTVTNVVINKTSPWEEGMSDEKTWIWALIAHSNGSSRWVPVTSTWKLYLTQDWDPSKRIRDMPGGVKIMEWNQSTLNDFPKIVEPQELRDWYFITLSAWRTQFEEMGQGYNVNGVWLTNGSTLALYNVTFTYMGVNGSRTELSFWQPIAVSTFSLRAEARYDLTDHEAALPGRRKILMYIYVNLTWRYVPPLSWQLLGFRVHAPQLGFSVTLEEPSCNCASCIGHLALPSRAGPTWRLYVISLGDTEEFFSREYPRGLLGGDGYSGVRSFRLAARWLGASYRPSTLVWGSERVSFKLAPATVYKLDWSDPRGPYTVTWGCFAQGPSGLTPVTSFRADLTFDWGAMGSTHRLKGTRLFTNVDSPYMVNVQVLADDWIAFYPLPARGMFTIVENTLVPVPLVAKYPPRG